MQITFGIKSLNPQEKPREKLINLGVKNLTNEELLAIIIRSGGIKSSVLEISREILKKHKNFKNISNLEIEELSQFKNIGLVKATCIKAACEIGLRFNEDQINEKITTPKDVYDSMYKELFGKQKEYLYLINLDIKNKIISKDILTIGTVDQSLITSKEVFKQALSRKASSIILVHNHPSNDATPSKEDILATELVAEAGMRIGIPLIDHIIFADSNYTSLKSLNIFKTYKF